MISKYIILNIESHTDRKKHIIDQFKRHSINNYMFFKATTPSSKNFHKIYNFDNLVKYPPCIRPMCNIFKKNDICECPTNILIKNQIANFTSFIKIMEYIVDQQLENFIAVGEDDIVLHDQFNEIVKNIFTQIQSNKELNMEKPIIIGLCASGSLIKTFYNIEKYKITNIPKMSNPFFIINSAFAKSFLKNFTYFYTTSDRFIHNELPTLDSSIQNFYLNYPIAYELSWIPLSYSREKIDDLKQKGWDHCFCSSIHPRSINDQDKEIKKTHVMKIDTISIIKEKFDILKENFNSIVVIYIHTYNCIGLLEIILNNNLTKLYFNCNILIYRGVDYNKIYIFDTTFLNIQHFFKNYILLECTLIFSNDVNKYPNINILKSNLYNKGYQSHPFFTNLHDVQIYYNRYILKYKLKFSKNDLELFINNIQNILNQNKYINLDDQVYN